MMLNATILYFTDNRLDSEIAEKCQKHLLAIRLPIVSVSLKPMDFGRNIVIDAEPSIVTIYKQIYAGLEACKKGAVFFAEHDVLYHKSHFNFRPPRIDTYYYNINVWRWAYKKDWFITYDSMVSLSGLCASRDLLLYHYWKRLDLVGKKNLPNGRNPDWARKWGHEPGKSRKRGGIMDEPFEERCSAYPNIDIRHSGCMTPQKMTLDSFVHQPTGWREACINQVMGWTREDLWN